MCISLWQTGIFWSDKILFIKILFPSPNFTQFSAYVCVEKENIFHENLEKDGSTWKIIGITDFLPAIPLKSAMRKQMADYFPSLFMLPKELEVRIS